MSDNPILFSPAMVCALLEGRKTQTRRLLCLKGHRGFFQFGKSDVAGHDWTFRRADHVWEDYDNTRLLKFLPFQTGDLLWVRENWCGCKQMDAIPPREFSRGEPIGYLADGETISRGCMMIAQGKSRPSIHMPRWASRLTLEVTDVRVELLDQITSADAVQEGLKETCYPRSRGQTIWQDYTTGRGIFIEPRDSFQSLWNSINGPDAWGQNPWVAAYTFKLHKTNIDEVKL